MPKFGNEKIVVFFSRTGNTRVMAQKIAELKGAHLVELKTTGFETGVSGWFKSQFTGIFNPTVATDLVGGEFSAQTVVYLGFPVWYWRGAAPLTSFVRRSRFQGASVVLFATMESSYSESAINDLKVEIERNGGRVKGFQFLKLKELPARNEHTIREETTKLFAAEL